MFAIPYTLSLLIRGKRRRFGGRQPLCGIGVTSRMLRTSMPAVASARIAAFPRPELGPETRTSTERRPWSRAALAAPTAARCAANGVPLRGAAEAERTRTLPAERVARLVGDSDDGVVERSPGKTRPNGKLFRSRLLELSCSCQPCRQLPCSESSPWLISSLSSYRRQCPCVGPCGYERWCGHVGREPEANGGGEDHGRTGFQ